MNNSTVAANDSNGSQWDAFDIFYIALAIVALVLNSCVIIIVSSKNFISGRIPKMLLLNNCCSDCACCLVRASSLLFGKSLVVPGNAFGTLLCRLMKAETLYWSVVQVSLNSLILLTVEQYIAVVHHTTHKRLKTWFIALCIALCWILGFVVNSSSLFEADREGSSCTQISLDPVAFKVYGTEVLLAQYILPFIGMVYCYTRIILTLRRSSLRMAGQKHPAVAFRRIQRDLSYTICILEATILILFAPGTISYFLYTLSVLQLAYGHWFYQLTTLFINLYFIVSPLSCMIRMRSFRRAITTCGGKPPEASSYVHGTRENSSNSRPVEANASHQRY